MKRTPAAVGGGWRVANSSSRRLSSSLNLSRNENTIVQKKVKVSPHPVQCQALRLTSLTPRSLAELVNQTPSRLLWEVFSHDAITM